MLLLDTNVVSMLFNEREPQYAQCFQIVNEHERFISFMTRSELLLWPLRNCWGSARIERLQKHMGTCVTLMPDEETCAIWAGVVDHRESIGHPISNADAWIAATALQWNLPLVTANLSDFNYLEDLLVVPVTV